MKKFLMLAGILLTSGCTPEKAEQLRAAALNFRNAAHAAIGAVEAMQQAEIAPPPKTTAEKDQEFIKNMMALSTSPVIDQAKFQTILDPDAVQLSAAAKSESASMIESFRTDYAEFAAMFEPLPKGSFLAQTNVAQTKRIAQKLVAQLVNLATAISQNPPRLQQHRTKLLGDVRRMLKSRQNLSQEEFRVEALSLKDRAHTLDAQEAELQRATVERCLAAALIGKELIPLIESYGKLDVKDIGNIIHRAFNVQEAVTGRPMSDLRGRLDNLVLGLEADPEIKALLTVAKNSMEKK